MVGKTFTLVVKISKGHGISTFQKSIICSAVEIYGNSLACKISVVNVVACLETVITSWVMSSASRVMSSASCTKFYCSDFSLKKRSSHLHA